MTSEFTYYALFVMLTVSMGVIFQFFLGSIRKINKDVAKINQSINNLHKEIHSMRASTRNQGSKVVHQERSSRNKTLKGNLELEYQGAKAITAATFYVNKET